MQQKKKKNYKDITIIKINVHPINQRFLATIFQKLVFNPIFNDVIYAVCPL